MIKNVIILMLLAVGFAASARTVRQTYGYQDGDNNVTFQKTAISYETSGELEQGQVINVATSETLFAVSAGIVAGNGPGLVLFHHEGTGTNDIQIGTASDTYPLAIPAGRGLVGWLDSGVTGLFFKAAATSANFRIQIYER